MVLTAQIADITEMICIRSRNNQTHTFFNVKTYFRVSFVLRIVVTVWPHLKVLPVNYFVCLVLSSKFCLVFDCL